jgi:hypothetical protein
VTGDAREIVSQIVRGHIEHTSLPAQTQPPRPDGVHRDIGAVPTGKYPRASTRIALPTDQSISKSATQGDLPPFTGARPATALSAGGPPGAASESAVEGGHRMPRSRGRFPRAVIRDPSGRSKPPVCNGAPGDRTNEVWPHHLVVFVLDDVAVPDEEPGAIEFRLNACDLARIGDDSVF